MARWERKLGVAVLEACGVNMWSFERAIEVALPNRGARHDSPEDVDCSLLCKVAETACQEAESLGHAYVGTEHLVSALLQSEDGILRELFERHHITYSTFKEKLAEKVGKPRVT
jgi:ATP-dependent Clp protease ATP-binding subunit ClpA